MCVYARVHVCEREKEREREREKAREREREEERERERARSNSSASCTSSKDMTAPVSFVRVSVGRRRLLQHYWYKFPVLIIL